MKPVKDAISVIIKNKKRKTLFALRGENEDSFPLTWSLPSHFVRENESIEETVKRIGRNKLGVELKIVKFLGERKAERKDFILFMHDYEAEIIEGEPHITKTHPYKELKWEYPEKQFAQMHNMGDCCKVYKSYLEDKSA